MFSSVGIMFLLAAGAVIVALIPWLGGLVDFVVLLLGLGAAAVLLYSGYGRRRVART